MKRNLQLVTKTKIGSQTLKSGILTETYNYQLSGFASDLGLRAGEVPQSIEVEEGFGTGRPFILTKVSSEQFTYKQEFGAFRLTLFND